MAKRNKKHEKRVKKLIVICVLSAIILTVSTYAWFIGMQTVSVNAFEVEITQIMIITAITANTIKPAITTPPSK